MIRLLNEEDGSWLQRMGGWARDNPQSECENLDNVICFLLNLEEC
jgi:hypothetical protein